MVPANKVLIVGGGIAGLSASITLARQGRRVRVVELYRQALGAAITITNRGIDALHALGILQECVAVSYVPQRGQSFFANAMNANGEPMALPPLPSRPEDGLPSFLCIYRPKLANVLAAAARSAGVEIEYGKTVRTVLQSDDSVQVIFSDESSDVFDLVIGADGINSTVRQYVCPDVKGTYTGWMSLRAMFGEDTPGTAGFYFLGGHNAVVTIRLPGDGLYMATGFKMENRHLGDDEARELVADILAPCTAPLLQAMAQRLTEQVKVIARPYVWLLAPNPWHQQRVLLIGDAAHATTANLASGGVMALEDAMVLGEELAGQGSLTEALQSYSRRRYQRVKTVVNTSVELLHMQEDSAVQPAQIHAVRTKASSIMLEPY